MVNPVPGYSVSTAYKKTGSHWTTCGWHTGQDYSAPSGQSVVAARAGTVEYVGYGSSFGSHQFAVRPGDGTEDFYAHTRTRPPSGQKVGIGEYLAQVGQEGNATGPHLHFERHKSYGWGCSLMQDPMLSHNHAPDTPAPAPEPEPEWLIEGVIMATAYTVFFFQHAGGTYEADILAGTYRHLSQAALDARRAVLTTAGIPYLDQPDYGPPDELYGREVS